MITLNLGQQPMTIEELLQRASTDAILIVDQNGDEFVLELADAFEREVAELGQSETFMALLAERARKPGVTTLEEMERRLA